MTKQKYTFFFCGILISNIMIGIGEDQQQEHNQSSSRVDAMPLILTELAKKFIKDFKKNNPFKAAICLTCLGESECSLQEFLDQENINNNE